METDTQKLIARVEPPIGWMIFNNPARRNAVSVEMWAAIPRVLDTFDRDPQVRVVVMAGAGDKAFISGADISQFEDQRANREANERYSALSGKGFSALAIAKKPSIAMIRGYCLGGGLAVALSCDLRIAAEDARFGIPAARLGLGYGFDGVRRLADIVGPAFASEILLTARQLNAEEALRIGLINRMVPTAELESVTRDYARMIGENAPLTVLASKMAVREVLKDPEHRKLDELEAAVAACFESADYAEGRRAFMEKRKPNFQGR